MKTISKRSKSILIISSLLWLSTSVLNVSAAPAAKSVLPGDSNCDGVVNVIDAVTTVNYIMGANPEPFCFDNADVNGDGIINVIDVVGTVNIILGGGTFECGVSTVSDIDGNVYNTVLIGDQCWMAENLRTKTFNTGDTIPGPFAGDDWVAFSTNGQNPAYAIYDHNHSAAEGLESPEEVVAAYGKMYNWHAVGTGNLCPEGWSVPDTLAWNQMIDYIITANPDFNEDNVAMAVKACRQINHPLGGDCATDIHPRWRENADHYGVDTYGLGLVAAGYILSSSGNSSWMAARGYWWTSSAHSTNPDLAIFRRFNHTDSVVSKGSFNRGVGQPVRCIKD